MFATGVENSIPTIDGGRERVDQMESCGHYKHWRTDFALLKELGIRYLRYGPPLHTTFTGLGQYNWDFADETYAAMCDQGIVPITDLYIGLIKAPVFGAIIAIAGCFQGMQVEADAEQVGLRTTSAVVQGIFLVIVLDAFFAVFFTWIGWN